MRTTTLKKMEDCKPSSDLWDSLLDGLGKTKADDEPLSYSSILKICGLHDAIWATRTESDCRWVQKLGILYARHISHLMNDPRSVVALDVAESFLRGEASQLELDVAYKDATDAYSEATAISTVATYATAAAASTIAAIVYDNASVHVSTIVWSVRWAAITAAATVHEEGIEGAYDTEIEWQKQEFLKAVS